MTQTKQKTLASIKVTRKPNTINYIAGEKFDKTGMIVTAYYTDNTSKTITDYTCSPRGALRTRNKGQIIIYTEGNVTQFTECKITVMEPSNDTLTDKIENNIDNDKNNNIVDIDISNQIQESENQPSSGLQNIQTNTITQIENSNYKLILIIMLVSLGLGVVTYIVYKYKKRK